MSAGWAILGAMKFSNVPNVVALAKTRLKALKADHPRIDARVVFSLPTGQCELDDSIETILLIFPDFFAKSERLAPAIKSAKRLKRLLSPDTGSAVAKVEEIAALKSEIQEFQSIAEVNGKVQVELRFGELCYDLIDEIKRHPLVDSKLTDPSRASIRVVLGTVEGLLAGSEVFRQ